jgi:hypothetical protein
MFVCIACADEGALCSWALVGEITHGLVCLGRRQVKLAVAAECQVAMIATSKDCDPFWVPWRFMVQTWQTHQGSLGFICFVKHFGTVILDQSSASSPWSVVQCLMISSTTLRSSSAQSNAPNRGLGPFPNAATYFLLCSESLEASSLKKARQSSSLRPVRFKMDPSASDLKVSICTVGFALSLCNKCFFIPSLVTSSGRRSSA